jgi:Flp pilus assembly protein TadG
MIERLGIALRREEGATLVEAAVGLVVLLALFIAILQICLALYASHFVADAAREGSRYAIVRGSTS